MGTGCGESWGSLAFKLNAINAPNSVYNVLKMVAMMESFKEAE